MRPHFCESPFYREKVASLTESLPFEFGRPHFRTLSTFPTFSAEMSVQILFEIGRGELRPRLSRLPRS